MRIQVSEEIEKQLDEIASQNYCYGKGHTGTIQFLVRHYKRHGNVEKLVDEKLKQIPAIIEKQLRKVVRDFMVNLTNPAAAGE